MLIIIELIPVPVRQARKHGGYRGGFTGSEEERSGRSTEVSRSLIQAGCVL